jgi:hypothetical protein
MKSEKNLDKIFEQCLTQRAMRYIIRVLSESHIPGRQAMTSTELALSIWGRRRPNTWSISITRKQVDFFIRLLRQERRDEPTSQRVYPIYTAPPAPPLDVVVYPNGAGFIRVAQYALTPDPSSPSKWRLKTESELAAERKIGFAGTSY